MFIDKIDWLFDTAREETVPYDAGSYVRRVLKLTLSRAVLGVLMVLGVIIAVALRPKGTPVEFVVGVVTGGLILVYCVFLVLMTARRHSRRNHERLHEDAALYREIAQYYRKKRTQDHSSSPEGVEL